MKFMLNATEQTEQYEQSEQLILSATKVSNYCAIIK